MSRGAFVTVEELCLSWVYERLLVNDEENRLCE